MSFPKTVAIIGAGPSGLAAAKILLHNHPHGTFLPTVFEKLSHVGGLWPVREDDYANIVHPDMPTNLSKHTISFSGLSWDSLSSDHDMEIPMFPKAHQVGKYLQQYANKYIPTNHLNLNCEVLHAFRDRSDNIGKWRVEWRGANPDHAETNPAGDLQVSHFDYLLVASGFFSKPSVPDLPGLAKFTGKVIHSSRMNDLGDIIDENNRGNVDNNIVVIGGSMSGAEAAASLAFHFSSAKHSSNTSPKLPPNYSIHHVTTRSFWSVPPYCPTDPVIDSKTSNPRPTFMPFDLILTDLTRRPKEKRSFLPSSTYPPQVAEAVNGFLSTLIGSNQSNLGDGTLAVQASEFSKPPWLIISAMHAEFVRTGEITMHLGSATEIDTSSVTIRTPDSRDVVLDNVSAIVMATGFSPHPALSFLDASVLETMSNKSSDTYMPLALHNYSTMHPSVPSLGFVGFYRGPYWGVIEQQARFLGALWSDAISSLAPNPPVPVSQSQRGQFPMGDYVGLMESFSTLLGTQRLPISSTIGVNNGPAIAARYATTPNQDEQEAEEVKKSLISLAKTLENPVMFTGPAVFRALHGRWWLTREIKSASHHTPSGRFTGEAHMHPRSPTEPGYAAEYLYMEKGRMTMDNGINIEAYKHYVYRLSAQEPQKISCWFVKPGMDSKEVDYIFHEIEFEEEERESRWGKGWTARGEHHLCIEDHYDTDYCFKFQGIEILEWGIGYVVKGPKKDYTTKATYTR
ncbi:FAD/NAD(P)-binding domain-containing protein [Serendipita vermifera]|nr:FAD/NAD(P)-binding domain-containing protein [Serendipita vermifera]